VLEAEPPRRSALLESADPEVRSEVEGLLSGTGSESSPLERDVLSHVGALLADEAETQTDRAHDAKLGSDVAIKTLPKEFGGDPERLSRFHREAREDATPIRLAGLLAKENGGFTAPPGY
jgi:hypothetical protein